METLDQAWSGSNTASIDDTAAAMKAAARARLPVKSVKAAALPSPDPAPVKKPRKPRVAKPPAESGAVVAIRREITGHECEIKRLEKALKALGAA